MKRFPDGARVCFVGDSITATFEHEARVAAFYKENFPQAKVQIFNCGTAGGTAAFALDCLKEDTLIHNPTHAVIMLGVNDSGRWLLGTEKNEKRYSDLVNQYEKYKKKLVTLCDALENEGVDITLCTPAPYAEYQETSEPALKGGYALMLGYAQFCEQLAKERSYKLCDYHGYLTKILQTTDIYRDDHVHPTELGQYYMAKCFLESQGLEIGEFAPIPDYLSELRETTMILRNIRAVELMVIRDFFLSDEEKIKIVQEYVYENRAPTDYFRNITRIFLEKFKDSHEIIEKTQKLTKDLMG